MPDAREREESALALMGVTRLPPSPPSLPSAGAARRPTNHVAALNHVSSERGPLRFLNREGSLMEVISQGSAIKEPRAL